MKTPLRLSALAFLTIWLLAIPSTAKEPRNVVFIIADDLGYGELGVYGQEKIRTPNLDQLAHEGTRFTRHYSGAPVCAPARRDDRRPRPPRRCGRRRIEKSRHRG